jgi:inner membrane protein YidH
MHDENSQQSAGDKMAVERTRLAYERTLLAWVRTATGLITFGFTIYKFFHLQHAVQPPGTAEVHVGSRPFGILMIATGLLALLLATIEHARNMRTMRAQYGRMPVSLAGVMAGLISILGIVGLYSALFRQ